MDVERAGLTTQAMLDELRGWVEIESPSHDAAGVNRLMDVVSKACVDAGLTIERMPGTEGLGDILCARSPGESNEPALLVLAHLDTVHPVGTLAGPLPFRVEGDKAYGPGIYDMKSCAYLALAAWRMLKAEGRKPRQPLTILFVPDEEVGSTTSRPVIEAEARKSFATLVVEPARDGGKVVRARKGVATIDVRTIGRPSHAGSRPLDGRSAIRELAHVILALEAMNDHEAGITVTVGQISGGTARNVVPAEAIAKVDVRVAKPDQWEPLIARMRAIKPKDPDVKIEVTGGLNRPPFAADAGCDALFERAREVAVPMGIALEGVVSGGGSDGNFTAALGVPTLDGLGADGHGAHTLDEHIYISSLAPRARLLAELYATLDPEKVKG